MPAPVNIPQFVEIPSSALTDSINTLIVDINAAFNKGGFAGSIDWVNVKTFGATGLNVSDDTASIQAAINYATPRGLPVYIPAGDYLLSTPLTVGNGVTILGDNGRLNGFLQGSSLHPVTSAIISSDFTQQWIGFTMKGVGIVGGTKQIDLGLMHEVELEDVELFNPSQVGLIIVRGEKMSFERVRCDALITGGIIGWSIGRYEDSTFSAWPGGAAAFFGGAGAFIDRLSIQDCFFAAAAPGYFEYGIKTDSISNCTFDNVIVHGYELAGELGALYVQNAMYMVNFVNFGFDGIGVGGAPATAIINVAGVSKQCTFINTSPSFAGNCTFTKGISLGDVAINVTFIDCFADGDNSSTFGLWFANVGGSSITTINCSGACFHASPNALIKALVNQINCTFTHNNCGSIDVSSTNADLTSLLMADNTGTAAATSKWGALFSTGSGGSYEPFYVKKEGAWLDGRPILFTGSYGEVDPQSIQNYAANPVGNITAFPGSLVMSYTATENSSGALWVNTVGGTHWQPLLMTGGLQAYNTNSSTSSSTLLTGANIFGGSAETVLNMTGAISAASNAQLPAVSALLTAMGPNAIDNQSFKLRIINGGGTGSGVWTITTNTGWTPAGTMTLAASLGCRDFYVTITSVGSVTATIQSLGGGTVTAI